MRRSTLGLAFIFVTLSLLAMPALAGGWAAVALDELPLQVRAGQTLNLGFTVRQHGVRPVSDARPLLFARNAETGTSVQAEARREGADGHYVVEVTFLDAGTWEWGVDPKPWPVVEFEPLEVLPATAGTKTASATAPWLVVPALALALGLVLAIRGKKWTRKAGTAIGLLGLVGLAVMLWPSPITGMTDSAPPDACPVTRPPRPPFVPPPPYPALALDEDTFWYGTEALWTMLPTDGVWRGFKAIPWWRPGYNYQDDPQPQMTVTGRRLDAPAPPLVAHEASNAYHPDFLSAMFVGVHVPTAGCWEITGHYEGHELSFVAWHAP